MVTFLERPEVEAVAFGPTVFCGTGEVYMEATGAPVLAWNNGDEGYFTTITEAGVYYATGTAENGCRDTSPGIEVILVIPIFVSKAAQRRLLLCLRVEFLKAKVSLITHLIRSSQVVDRIRCTISLKMNMVVSPTRIP
jgi:hypothetical protein